MFTAAIIIIALLAALFFRYFWWRLIKTKWYGIETDAIVTRMEAYTCSVGGAAEYPRRFYYARYQTQNGLQNEARLLNPKPVLGIGSKIRIKYLDDKADYAVLTEISR